MNCKVCNNKVKLHFFESCICKLNCCYKIKPRSNYKHLYRVCSEKCLRKSRSTSPEAQEQYI